MCGLHKFKIYLNNLFSNSFNYIRGRKLKGKFVRVKIIVEIFFNSFNKCTNEKVRPAY